MKNLHRILAGVILLVGLASASVIYLATSENDSDEVLGAQFVIDHANSKMYLHDLRVYGGNTNVYIDEFIHWFAGLWHGKSLAYTIACLTVFISACSFWFGDLMYMALMTDVPDKKH